MNEQFLILFLIISILNLISLFIKNRTLTIITKTLLMPTLIIYYITNTSNFNIIVVIALIFAFLGDTLLLLDHKDFFFLLGAFSFLIGHICYIYIFITNFNPSFFNKNILFVIPIYFILYFISINRLKKHTSNKILAVSSIYCAILYIMSLTALLRLDSVTYASFLPTYIGSILFIISDTSLGIKIFIKRTKFLSILVMLTYILAQLLIVRGLMHL